MNASVGSTGRSGVWYESTESMMESRGLNAPHLNLSTSQNRGNLYDGRVLDAEPMNMPDFNMRQVFIPRNMSSKGPSGIGIRFLKEGNEVGPYTVTYVDPQGTAFQSQKVKVGDLIHQVDGILVYDLMPDEVTSRILGPPGSFVSLTISDPPVILPSVSPRDIQTRLIPSEPKSQAPLLDVALSRCHKDGCFTPKVETFQAWYEVKLLEAFYTWNGAAYRIEEMTWHTPSEHQIDGKSYPAELQLLYKTLEGSYAMLIVLVVSGSSTPSFIRDAIPKFPKTQADGQRTINFTAQDVLTQVGLSVNSTLQTYSYVGSLTRPPCSEGVRVFVLQSTITMRQDDVDLIRSITGSTSRTLQALNSRIVYKSS
ncbi:hypothetical protein GUITHDRAFT_148625 [Guillardia theta CCMP2712]|uniref:carbonic anhydrase n=1 Tax=Guillardia theta (strain CCMP2712) TaxID=905079 RepID=L1I9B7_GUITC|nr:hypothetical protein GUITHDRAFT_148625 [Guillardia theta CCMP2712]EKX32450.1 hypothetical protein GUITHDRAFT_148625 [Guillardia theta CCMP2712]|eukprot:XP_005819430.1 hypothetical protein GUITHDRAFT_148625 [Guillardia theta CCMP2712]